ncbi:MAG TPA: YdcF family protein [Alphaproteobacteria bacterium]|nr:YdcF family protein [Alphaproteobacteria bacterium]
MIATPLSLLWIMVAIGFALRFWKRQWGNRLLILSGIIFLTVGFLPIGYNMVVFLENQYERPDPMPDKVDGIIVLGGAFNSGVSEKRGMMAANGNINRMIDFVDLMKKYPKATAIFAGGTGNIYNPERKEADDAKAFLEMMGISLKNVIFERQSRNSYENIKFSQDLVKPKNGETWILVTSAFHMGRSMGVFKKLNWDVIAYPSGPKTTGEYILMPQPLGVSGSFYMLSTALKEFIGSAIYYFSGKSAFLFPTAHLESGNSTPISTDKNGTK